MNPNPFQPDGLKLLLLASTIALASAVTTAPADAANPGSRLAKPSVSAANVEARRRTDAPRQRGDINVGNNVNIGNDVNIDRDVDIDVDPGYGHWGPHYHHPIAAGVVIGTVAVTSAAVAGAYYHSLPTGCTIVYHGGDSYYLCGSVHYRRTWYGNDVVYVVVDL